MENILIDTDIVIEYLRRVHYEALRLMKKEGLSEKEAHEKAGNILTADIERHLAKAMADVLKTRGWGQHAIQRQNIPGFKKTDVFETFKNQEEVVAFDQKLL